MSRLKQVLAAGKAESERRLNTGNYHEESPPLRQQRSADLLHELKNANLQTLQTLMTILSLEHLSYDELREADLQTLQTLLAMFGLEHLSYKMQADELQRVYEEYRQAAEHAEMVKGRQRPPRSSTTVVTVDTSQSSRRETMETTMFATAPIVRRPGSVLLKLLFGWMGYTWASQYMARVSTFNQARPAMEAARSADRLHECVALYTEMWTDIADKLRRQKHPDWTFSAAEREFKEWFVGETRCNSNDLPTLSR